MTFRILLIAALASCCALAGCGEMVGAMLPDSIYIQPASASKTLTADSTNAAMKAAIAAATSSGWTPKTISPETGYLFAEQDTRVAFRGTRNDSFKLEVTLPAGGRGTVIAKVTPPPKISGTLSTQKLVDDYLIALDHAVSTGP